nr:magnesium chelatase ATPase subunit D [Burkholderiaceae bacterium]
MADDPSDTSPPWADAACAAALLAVDPVGLGGVVLRAGAGPVRDRWLAGMQSLSQAMAAPLRRMPSHITDGRLLGGLDLAATLRAGRPVAERGLLADCDGGLLLLPMAERLAPSLAARLAAVLDSGELRVERDGLALAVATRFGVIVCDEGEGDDPAPPAALLDRLALRLDLTTVAFGESAPLRLDPVAVQSARARLAQVELPARCMEALCALAAALGIDSLRAPLLALKAARAHAAWAGRLTVEDADIVVAGRLVLAARATRLPSAPQTEDTAAPPPDDALPDATEGETDDLVPRDPDAPL